MSRQHNVSGGGQGDGRFEVGWWRRQGRRPSWGGIGIHSKQEVTANSAYKRNVYFVITFIVLFFFNALNKR